MVRLRCPMEFLRGIFSRAFFQRYTFTMSAFSLNGEYFVRFFLPNGVFLPCDHGVFFLLHLNVIIQSIKQSISVSSPFYLSSIYLLN